VKPPCTLTPAGFALKAAAAPPPAPKGSPGYPLTARDILEFGRCPARWVDTPPPEDPFDHWGPGLVPLRVLAPECAGQKLIRRPDTYEAAVLRCQNCQSAGPGKVCKKCGLTRKMTLEPKPWTSAAKACQEWLLRAERLEQRVIPPLAYDRAARCAARLNADPEFRRLRAESRTLELVAGPWPLDHPADAAAVQSWVHLAPSDSSANGDALVQVALVDNADPGLFENKARTGGYGIRAALKLALWNAATGDTRRQLLWFLVERDAPHLVARRIASEELLKEGRDLLGRLLEAYQQCVASQRWPAFDPQGVFTPVNTQPWLTTALGATGGYFALTQDRLCLPEAA
jgi:hypothetical protein